MQDSYAKFKYDVTKEQDETIPVVGATKFHHIEGAAKAVELELTEDEIHYLEEPYVPHALVGVMAQNRPESAKEKHVWSAGNQKI